MGNCRDCALALMAASVVFGSRASAAPDDGGTSRYATAGYSQQSGGQLRLASVVGRIGVRFEKYVGVEGEFHFGVDHHRFVYYPYCATVCPDVVFLEQGRLANSEGLYGMGYLPLTDYLDLFARAGYRFSNYAVGPALQSGLDVQAFEFGLGAQVFVDDGNGLRADFSRQLVTNKTYTNELVTGSAVNVWSISIVHRF